ncbi:LicD family protein [Stappia sp. F7233]|uniref:LicD family protein n=2 Tax=Stappia albiluteola TaxID=2758565 RepID=A0A839AF18_9HYPH|nr:LicD family protein [Stappia albiluteola]
MPALSFAGEAPFLLCQKEQEKIIDLARYTDEFLTRNGISYVLAWGSLLGAERHQGMVPWDDDVDFALYRKADIDRMFRDYEDLAAQAKRDGYVLHRIYNHWKMTPQNATCHPILDIYKEAHVYCEDEPVVRVPFDGLLLSAPAAPHQRIAELYGESALKTGLHEMPFWDSSAIPPLIDRLLGPRVIFVATRLYKAAFLGHSLFKRRASVPAGPQSASQP